jgi:hypothetical protein
VRRGDRASTLLFFPAALLVVVVLASITVDLARLRLVQRQADDAASGAANDAVTAGLDVGRLRNGDEYRLDVAAARRIVAASVAAHDQSGTGGLEAATIIDGPRSLAVTVTGRSPLAFARVVPGAPTEVTVRATARATARLR